jgi:hypothetical protein
MIWFYYLKIKIILEMVHHILGGIQFILQQKVLLKNNLKL